MRQPRLWIEIAIVLIVAVIAFVVGRVFFPAAPPSGSENVSMNGAAVEDVTGQIVTREEVPPGVVVPDQTANVPANVARPEVVVSAAPDTESKKRVFSISIDGGKFIPDTVILNAGDIANVTFTAVDRSYEVVQPDHGFRLNIPAGESKLLEAQFNIPGKYTFYCGSCGGPDAGPRGYFTVVP